MKATTAHEFLGYRTQLTILLHDRQLFGWNTKLFEHQIDLVDGRIPKIMLPTKEMTGVVFGTKVDRGARHMNAEEFQKKFMNHFFQI